MPPEDQDAAADPWRGPEPHSRTFTSQRLRLHYADWGGRAGRPLLLLHGGRDHCRSWDWTAAALRSDWRVLAPDLRGHGDSAWSPDGSYALASYLYDLAQLVHQEALAPLTLIAHSLGGAVALRFAGLYPEAVRRLVVIEGLGPSPQRLAQRAAEPVGAAWRRWMAERRALAARQPRRYGTFDEALARMRAENERLSDAQARHLTWHGLNRNEDGSFSWKFDNYCRSIPPADVSEDHLHALWGAIACPTLLIYGRDSSASNPAEDGRLGFFRTAEVSLYEDAGHWVHHDQTNRFIREAAAFVA